MCVLFNNSGQRGRFCTAQAHRRMVRWFSHGHPENHPSPGKPRPEGKNSRFRQQCGIFSVEDRLIQLILWVLGLSKNLSSPVYGNTVLTAVTLAIRENGSNIAYFRTAHAAHGAPPERVMDRCCAAHRLNCSRPQQPNRCNTIIREKLVQQAEAHRGGHVQRAKTADSDSNFQCGIQGRGKFRPGTISQGIISPGENFATLEIPKARSKHALHRESKTATGWHNMVPELCFPRGARRAYERA